MKNLKPTQTAVIYFVAIMFWLCPTIQAQDKESPTLMFMRQFEVKPGHDAQFNAGLIAWKKCYNENKGDSHWNAWKRRNGEGTSYTMSRWMENWAELDEDTSAASDNCASLAINLITPHVESQTRNYARLMTEMSREFPQDAKVVYVGFFKVKDNDLFTEIVKSVEASVKAKEGQPRGVWYSSMGGSSDQSDYFVAVPMKNFAAMDTSMEGVWKVHAAEHGKKKSDEMREQFRNNLVSEWSYIYSLSEALSN